MVTKTNQSTNEEEFSLLIKELANLGLRYDPTKELNIGQAYNSLFKYIKSKYSLDNIQLLRLEYKEKQNILAERGKRKRIKKKLLQWQETNELYFVTMTFNEEYLNSTTEKQRETDIKQSLNKNSTMYIANKDFGKENGREHYHALVCNLSSKALKTYRKDMGFVDVRKVTRCLGTAVDYLMKLTNHSLKETSGKRLIYSRKKRESIDILSEI